MISLRDKKDWIMEKEEELSMKLYKVSFLALCSSLQGVVRRWAERDYNDTLADYAESRCKDDSK